MVFGCELRKPSVADQQDETELIYLPSRKCHKLYLFELLGAILFAGLFLLALVWILYYPPSSEYNLKIQTVERFLIDEIELDEVYGAIDIPVKIEEYKPIELEEYVPVKDSTQLGEYPDTEKEGNLTDAELLNRGFFSKKLRVRKAAEKQKARQQPKLIRIPRRAEMDEQGEWDRNFANLDEHFCLVPPKGLESAEIRCTQFPKTKVCISYCAYGTTLSEGITRTHICAYRQNAWNKPFEECKPFIDCTVRLVTPGYVRCKNNTLKEIPYCSIRCSRYEDKEPVKRDEYYCKHDGTWKPSLPFCATLKGIPLVGRPEKTEHLIVTYPKNQGEPKYTGHNDPWKWA